MSHRMALPIWGCGLIQNCGPGHFCDVVLNETTASDGVSHSELLLPTNWNTDRRLGNVAYSNLMAGRNFSSFFEQQATVTTL